MECPWLLIMLVQTGFTLYRHYQRPLVKSSPPTKAMIRLRPIADRGGGSDTCETDAVLDSDSIGFFAGDTPKGGLLRQ